jgi:hypothetical protein
MENLDKESKLIKDDDQNFRGILKNNSFLPK